MRASRARRLARTTRSSRASSRNSRSSCWRRRGLQQAPAASEAGSGVGHARAASCVRAGPRPSEPVPRQAHAHSADHVRHQRRRPALGSRGQRLAHRAAAAGRAGLGVRLHRAGPVLRRPGRGQHAARHVVVLRVLPRLPFVRGSGVGRRFGGGSRRVRRRDGGAERRVAATLGRTHGCGVPGLGCASGGSRLRIRQAP